MGTIRFVLRTDKPNKKEEPLPVDLIYQLKSQRKSFNTKKKLYAANWDAKHQKAIHIDKKKAKELLPAVAHELLPSSKEVEEINADLISIIKEVQDIENRFQLNKILYTTEKVVQALKDNRSPTTKTEAPANQVFDFIDKYIEDNKASREPGSMSVYKSLKNHLRDFQIKKKKTVTFDKIDFSFFLEFQNFLIAPRNKFVESKKKGGKGKWKIVSLNNTTIAKQLSTLKTFLGYARMHGIDVSNKYKEFKIKKENLEVIALTNDEFETLYNFDLSNNKRLDQVRDTFCFSCSTGLRFSDVDQLKREHIKHDEIRITVTKTKNLLHIPLNPYSLSILAKYSDMPRPLPVISNSNTNEYLKELCGLAEINDLVQIVRSRGNKREENTYPKYDLISFHTGRKTFATLSLEKGMSAEEVMKIGGWKSYTSFMRYVNITEQRSKVVMGKAWGEIPKSKLKVV